MVWALALVVVIGVGLPAGAWALTRKLPPPRPGSRLGVGYDSVDKWLLNRYQLPPHDRWRVRAAVSHGDRVNDPTLVPVAYDLAADLLTNRPWPMRFMHLVSWIMLAGAVAFACAGIIVLTTSSDGVAQGVLSLLDSGVFLMGGLLGRRGARQYRHNLTQALQLNRDGPALHS